jgi:hypothetical protein
MCSAGKPRGRIRSAAGLPSPSLEGFSQGMLSGLEFPVAVLVTSILSHRAERLVQAEVDRGAWVS